MASAVRRRTPLGLDTQPQTPEGGGTLYGDPPPVVGDPPPQWQPEVDVYGNPPGDIPGIFPEGPGPGGGGTEWYPQGGGLIYGDPPPTGELPPGTIMPSAGGGFMDPGDMKLDPPLGGGGGAGTNYNEQLMGVLGKYQYGPQSLDDIFGELSGLGWQMQNQQRGDLRPRVKSPTGEMFDIALGQSGDWSQQGTPLDGHWGALSRGTPGEGVWSLGGGGGSAPPMPSLGGGGAMPTTPGPGSGGPGRQDIWSLLQGVISGGGGANNEVINRRLEGARESMNKARSSQTSQYRSQLADRGLVGSGGEVMGASNLEEQLANTYAGAERDIYADEFGRADDRMMQALSLATGMTMDEARNAIERYKTDVTRELGLGRLGLDEMLGMGQLGLGNLNANMNWNQFLANYGLDRERFANDVQTGQFDQLARILQLLMQGAQTSSGGFV